MGLEPGNPDGIHLQGVPLADITSIPTFAFNVAGKTTAMTNINDYIGFNTRVMPHVPVTDSDVVFVGCLS
ncbi:MAG: hypothetical protein ABI222_02900 [Opitutaceae bacterium]